jgi:protein SCO1/2
MRSNFAAMQNALFSLFLAAAALFAGCGEPAPPPFRATDITGAPYGAQFVLTDHKGVERRLGDFRGKVVTLFFGFTQCPDVCPTNLTAMAEVMKLLGDDAKRIQVLFVTVDPERDTQELLAEYVPAFHPDFLGLRGDEAATKAAAREFKVFYQKVPGQTAGSYTMDHSAGTYVFDPAGRLRLYIKHGETPEAIAHDIRLLLAGR